MLQPGIIQNIFFFFNFQRSFVTQYQRLKLNSEAILLTPKEFSEEMQFIALAAHYKHVQNDMYDIPLPHPPLNNKFKTLSPSRSPPENQISVPLSSESLRSKSMSPSKKNTLNPFLNVIQLAKKQKKSNMDTKNDEIAQMNEDVTILFIILLKILAKKRDSISL